MSLNNDADRQRRCCKRKKLSRSNSEILDMKETTGESCFLAKVSRAQGRVKIGKDRKRRLCLATG